MTRDLVESRIAAGYEARREGRLAEAKAAFVQCEQICRAEGDLRGLARALLGVGQMERDLGNREAALGCYEEAAELYRGLSSAKRLGHALRHVADLLRELGRLVEADARFEEVVGMYRAEGDVPGLDVANALRGRALVKEELGEREAAVMLWREARELYAAGDVLPGVAECERRIGLLTAEG